MRPPFLKPGDTIGIIAPSSPLDREEILNALTLFESWGLKVEEGKHLFKTNHQFAGTDEERLEDFQGMLDNPGIKAIICARGGYGAIRILDRLDFTKFSEQPKWIVGFSDITLFHLVINEKLNYESIHGPMPINLKTFNSGDEVVVNLHKSLFGEILDYRFPGHQYNRHGEVSGKLIGGNLSILYSAMGTRFFPDTEGKILFIEDVGEYFYHLDRMLWSLKLAGKLSGLKALIVGAMSGMKDKNLPYGKTAYEIVAEAVEPFNFPVIYNFPAGHVSYNMPLIFGRNIHLKSGPDISELIF
ncbi:MAG: LD-carboxypeptidase [Bacteroidales bacterium]|nr:LD-carboxypeptidase [Bacteroidales bacterium]